MLCSNLSFGVRVPLVDVWRGQMSHTLQIPPIIMGVTGTVYVKVQVCSHSLTLALQMNS